MSLVPGRPRWAALPLALSLSVPLVVAAASPATAEAPSYRGLLSMTGSGPRYVAVDAATGGVVFTSSAEAVDGALGPISDGGGVTIAYVSSEGADASAVDRLHLVRPDAADTVLYSGSPGAEITEPAVAPNGAGIAFVVDDATSSAILTVDTASRAVRTVQRSTVNDYYGPSYSPDARYLSWAQDTDYGSDLVIAGADGTSPAVLAHRDGETSSFGDTAWSPDGTRLAVTVWQPAGDTAFASLALYGVRSAAATTVASGASVDGVTTSYVEPAWLPDGSGVYASKVRETDTGYDGSLVVVTTAGEEQPVAADGYLGSPSAAGPAGPADTTPPAPASWITARAMADKASVGFDLGPDAAQVADVIVTRVVGAAADTPTASITVARTRGSSLDVSLPAPDTTYGISVFTRDWAGNLSQAAKVQVTSTHRTDITLSVPAKVGYGATVRITGRVVDHGGNELVSLYARRAGTKTPVFQYSKRTDMYGAFTFLRTAEATTEYTVRYDGDEYGSYYPAVSPKRVVSVTSAVSLTLSASRVVHGRGVALTGSVKPSHAGSLVSIQRYVGGTWRTIASTRLSSTSTYRYVLKPATAGTWRLRVVKPADMDHLLSTSPTRVLTVT